MAKAHITHPARLKKLLKNAGYFNSLNRRSHKIPNKGPTINNPINLHIFEALLILSCLALILSCLFLISVNPYNLSLGHNLSTCNQAVVKFQDMVNF